MAKTASNMLALGTPAPDFNLLEPATGKRHSLAEIKSDKATVVMFISNHCPFVKHIAGELAQLARDYQGRAAFIAINSNDVSKYPEDSPEAMVREVELRGYNFPYLFDETQEVARDYEAACTPDFYLFDGALKLFYRGQLDDSRPDNGIPVTGGDLRAALDMLLTGRQISPNQKPSMGCDIKWKI